MVWEGGGRHVNSVTGGQARDVVTHREYQIKCWRNISVWRGEHEI